MKVCFITPTPLLRQLAVRSKAHLVLAHQYLKDDVYASFYRDAVKNGDFVMLDNSAYELGKSIDVDILNAIACDLKPNAIFLPDSRFNTDETLKLVQDAIPKLEGLKDINNNPVKLIAVPQGGRLDQVMRCYDRLREMGIKDFGIYEEIGTEEASGLGRRWDFLQYLEETERVTDGYYHMLGMEEDIQNIAELAKFDWVDSIDSVKPIAYGMWGIAFDPKKGPLVPYPHRQPDYFSRDEVALYSVIYGNCDKVLKWAGSSAV